MHDHHHLLADGEGGRNAYLEVTDVHRKPSAMSGPQGTVWLLARNIIRSAEPMSPSSFVLCLEVSVNIPECIQDLLLV